jgi:hypothetical protein
MMAMRFVLLGLLLAGCAHQKLYSIGDDLSVVADGLEVAVRDERQSIIVGMPKGPRFMMRPGKNFATTGCFEGFYNPTDMYLSDSRASTVVQPFVVCHDPEMPGDPDSFRLGLRDSGVPQSTSRTLDVAVAHATPEIQQFQFTARLAANDSTEVKVAGTSVRSLRLPPDAVPFRDHPQYVGAMVVLGVLPSGATSLVP